MCDISEWRKEFGNESFVPFETFCRIFETVLPANVSSQDLTGLFYPLLNLIEGNTFTDSEQVTPEMYNLLLQLFGPKEKVVLRVKDIVDHGYFHGELSGEHCTELLHHPGNFLFRMRKGSSQQLAIAYANQNSEVKHILITLSNGKYMLVKNEYHETLAEIVLKYSNKLKTPIILDIKGKYSKKPTAPPIVLLSPRSSPRTNFILPPSALSLSGVSQTTKKAPLPNTDQQPNHLRQKSTPPENTGLHRSVTQPQLSQQQQQPVLLSRPLQQPQPQMKQGLPSPQQTSAPQRPPPLQHRPGSSFSGNGAQPQDNKQRSPFIPPQSQQQQQQQTQESLRQSAPQFMQHARTLSQQTSVVSPSAPPLRMSDKVPPFQAPSPRDQKLLPPQQQAPLPFQRQNGVPSPARQDINPYTISGVNSEYFPVDEESTEDCRECEMSKFYIAKVYSGHASADIANFNKDKWIMELTTNLDFFSSYCQSLPYPSPKQMEKAKLIIFDLFSIFPDLPNDSFIEELGNLFSKKDLAAIVATMSDIILNGIPKETFL